MPHSTAHSAASSSHSRQSSHGFAEERTDPEESLAEDRNYVTVMGPASQVTLAAVIQQTYLLSRGSLPREMLEQRPTDKIKFTGFVGINLLHRLCRLPEAVLDIYGLHTIGVLKRWAASGARHLRRTWTDPPVDCSHSGLSLRNAQQNRITTNRGSEMQLIALIHGQVFATLCWPAFRVPSPRLPTVIRYDRTTCRPGESMPMKLRDTN